MKGNTIRLRLRRIVKLALLLCVGSQALFGQDIGGWQKVELKGVESDANAANSYVKMITLDNLHSWILTDSAKVLKTSDSGRSWDVGFADPKSTILGGFFLTINLGWVVGSTEMAKEKSRTRNVHCVIYRTDSGGKSWNFKTRIDDYHYCSLHDIRFINRKQGWAVGEIDKGTGIVEGAVFVTENGGRSWRLQYSLGENGSFLSALNFIDSEVGWAIGDGSILRTLNGGKRWEMIYKSGTADFFDMEVFDENTLLVVGSRGQILRTTDGGVTWENVLSETSNVFLTGVTFVNKHKGFTVGKRMGGASVVLSTVDNGKHWIEETFPRNMPIFRDVGVLAANRIMVLADEGTVLVKK